MKATAKSKKYGSSKLAKIGHDSMRNALLAALEKNCWHLTQTSEVLDLGGAANVIRQIKRLGLGREYALARATVIRHGGRHKRPQRKAPSI